MNQSPINHSIEINASTERVWKALTTPELIKQYMFGLDLTTDWKVGGTLDWKGIAGTKQIRRKGEILVFEPNNMLVCTDFNPDSGLEDVPANYTKVTYKLTAKNDKTVLEVLEENVHEDKYEEDKQFWSRVLEGLKKVAEA